MRNKKNRTEKRMVRNDIYPVRIDVHADDFALSIHNSREIIQCIVDGKLDSISIIPNMSCFSEAMRMLKEQVPEERFPKCAVHLNFMEGHCLSAPREVPDLVNRKGYFKVSWESLVIDNYRYGRRRNTIRRQLKTEIKAQIIRVCDSLPPGYVLRLDSHQHPHMIPVVFDALLDVIREENYKVEYIRFPEEPQWPFVRKLSLWPTYSPVNMLKNIVLNYYAKRNHRKIAGGGENQSISCNLVWGMMLSGSMDKKRVAKLWPAMMHYMEKRNRVLEILVHPGRVLPQEINEEYVKKSFVRFHLSEGRDREKETVYWIPRNQNIRER